MKKLRIFISSVQTEFATERKQLWEYLTSDPLFGQFFDTFIFENLPATNQSAQQVYIKEVGKCDIYLGILGKDYGYEDEEGVSPTEREFDEAVRLSKTKLLFLTNHNNADRHPKEVAMIIKGEKEVIRKIFSNYSELKAGVYASLIKYLVDKEIIRTVPFDAAIKQNVTLKDIDDDRIQWFIGVAKTKRGFPLQLGTPVEHVLTHLNLLNESMLSNAAILLFGKQPQKFFISSEIKCAHFHGTEITKPIPSYQVYKGDVFKLVDQAVDFVLAKINVQVGTRSDGVQAPVRYEIPRAVIAEAIVNAVAHRDYTSNGSVQVMLFSDRLEVWNPGQLPPNLTIPLLKTTHGSFPANPLLAEPMFFAGYIERLGTGTKDMVQLCKETGLKEPDFKQEDVFKVIIWRKNGVTGQVTGQPTVQVTRQVGEPIKRILLVLEGEMKRSEIQHLLELTHRETFMDNYLKPSMELGYVEMTHPDNPNHPNQKYRLTQKGLKQKNRLNNSGEKK